MNENLSFSVFTANIVSLLLLGTLYLSNRQRMSHDRDIRIVVFLSGSWLFLGNVLIGVVVQVVVVEVAITWTSIAVAIAGIMTALKNETIFLDPLTGLYNRVYLEFLQKQAHRRKNTWVCGIMIDLNGFKQINDNYGHAEVDTALILAAGLLKNAFGEYGVVTRYAGDEFVVMLNTTDEQLVRQLIQGAKENFEKENDASGRPYRLSASMGYAVADLHTETIADFMNRIAKNDRRKSQPAAADNDAEE